MVHTLDDIRRTPALLERCGGKGKNLFRLQLAGLPVPPLVVVPPETLETLFRWNHAFVREKLHALTRENLLQIAAELESVHPVADADAFGPFVQNLISRLNPARGFAVRSSVRNEDSTAASFAGLFETVLNVTPSDLPESLRTCLEATFRLPLLDYSLQKGIDPAGNPISIVIQEMVRASVSGVLFTMDASANYNDLLVCAAFGSGEGVVNNTSETTSYCINRQNRSVRKKEEGADILSDEQLTELFDTALRIEKLFGCPQDIEFSYDETGTLNVLQARPITTIDIHNLKIIDNTNIVESYPGITLPLSFSFARKAYREVFTSSARLFKLSESKIKEHEPAFSDMIVHVQGRVYYNLHHWYELMQLILSTGNSLQAWETLIGVQSKTTYKGVSSLFKRIRTTAISLLLFLRYPVLVARFYRNFDVEYDRFRTYLNDLPNSRPTLKEAFEFYQERSRHLFKDWSVTLLNDFFTFRFYDALNKLLQALGFAPNQTLANDLLCGTPGVESEQLVVELMQLTQLIHTTPAYKALFDLPDEKLLQQVPQDLQGRFDDFTARYGDRTLEELKLETPNMRLQPERFIRLIRSQLQEVTSPHTFAAKQQGIRSTAEQAVRVRLKGRWLRKLSYAVVLKFARESIKNRENMRLRRTRAYGLAKELFRYLADGMVEKGVLSCQDDVFFLTMDQLQDYCLTGSLPGSIDAIRETFATYESLSPPDRMVFNGDKIPLQHLRPVFDASRQLLFGTGISTGTIEAECVVLSKPDFDQAVQGKILVTRMTDPAWVFLMNRSVGLISEKGSALSHTAIVGRELGLPVIIGVTDATKILKTGMRIRMECDTGSIKILS